MAQAEVRRIETVVGETGAENRTEVSYQLGAVVDGGWVPFLTKSEGYALHLSSINQETNEQADTTSGSQTTQETQPTDGGETQTAS